MTIRRFAMGLLLGVVSATAQATVITIGSMARDTNSNTIFDSLNNREWLGWDVTRGLTYAETLSAVGAGGLLEGYSIARNAGAQLFVDALSPSSACTTSGIGTCFTDMPYDLELLVGETYLDYRAAFGRGYDEDFVFFLSDNGTGEEVGLIGVITPETVGPAVAVVKENESVDLVFADSYALNGSADTTCRRDYQVD